MTFFNRKPGKDALERLLKASRTDFAFEKRGIKARLMTDIEEKRLRDKVRGPFLRRHKWLVMTACLVLVATGSGVTLAKTNISKPGDALHAADQLHEKLILKLPMSENQKAKIRANIVDERNKELEYFLQAENHRNVRAEAVKESLQSLDQAVEQVRISQANLYSKGKTEQAEKMGQVLIRLETLAGEQEQKVESLKDQEQDEAVKKELEIQIEGIKKARERARTEPRVNGASSGTK
jgi:hypothetical protein